MNVEIRCRGSGEEELFDSVAPGVSDHAVDRATLSRYLGSPGHHLIVALSKGEIVGQVAAVVHRHPDLRPTELYIDEVAVTPSLQSQGIADRLLEGAFALCRRLGCVDAWLGSAPEKLEAKSIHNQPQPPSSAV